METIFWSGTKNLGPAQYVNSVYDLAEKFGQAQNILGPVKGRCNGPFAIQGVQTRYARKKPTY